jgi:hypothetical protein
MVDDKGRGDDEILYGACFKPIKYKKPYYEKFVKYQMISPWFGSPYEGTFMNAFKRGNEPPVKMYKDLVLWPIPQNKFDMIEGFSGSSCNLANMLIIAVIILIILYIILYK